ncbi:MAG: inositol monophosphatase family protein [Dehalococcoidia bacterium]
MVYLASGRVSGVIHFPINSPVHAAAGCLLASEAGAMVTDLDGRPWSLTSTGFVASSTPALHHDLLQLLAQSRPEQPQ